MKYLKVSGYKFARMLDSLRLQLRYSILALLSENKVLADTISRLDEGAVLPAILTKVPRSVPRRDGFRIIGR